MRYVEALVWVKSPITVRRLMRKLPKHVYMEIQFEQVIQMDAIFLLLFLERQIYLY